MARRSLLGGLFTFTAAAAAVAGVAYLFKEEIRDTDTYKNLNDKYDVDTKIKTYSEKAKDTAYDLKDKAKVAAKDIKAKTDEWKSSKEDDIFDDDEIILDADVEQDAERTYVSIQDAAEEAKEEVAASAEEVKDNIKEAAENVKEAAENIEID